MEKRECGKIENTHSRYLKNNPMKIKILILIAGALSMTIPLKAFTLKGKVVDLPLRSKVYLYTSPPGCVEQKWTLSHLVDSTIADKEGKFEFRVKDADYARLWRVAIPGKTLKCFSPKMKICFLVGKWRIWG